MSFYDGLRQRMIDTMQISLRQIRQVLNLGVQEFSDIVGLTRQSINNLESSKIKMSTVQFVAICAVIDHFVESQPELLQIIISILNSNDELGNNCIFDDLPSNSLLKKWFLCFPDDSKIISANADIVDDLVDNYKIFLDDTALCEIVNINQIASLIAKMNHSLKRFIIPLRAIDSIQSQLLKEDNTSVDVARKGMDNLQSLQELGISEIRGEQSDVNIMTTLLTVFVKYKVVYRLALITQNRKLAESILSLNNDEIGGFPIIVMRCTLDGALQKWEISNEVECKEMDSNEYDSNDNVFDDSLSNNINDSLHDCENDDSEELTAQLSGWEEI